MRTSTRRIGTALAAAVVAALVAGCGGQPSGPASAPPARPTAPPTAPAPPPPVPDDEPEATEPVHEPALVARASQEIEVYDSPADASPGTSPARTLPAATDFGSPTVLLVTQVGHGLDDGWLEVSLPVRPNGSTGWIRADLVDVETVDLEVVVDLDARELTVTDAGAPVLTATAAIGTDETPTPTGRFYVTDKLDTGDPDGPYGPYALGLSARSEVLTEFAGGDGQVGLHGTNEPDSIGQASSNGCIRVDNDLVEELAALLPLGTPVTIT